MRAAVLSSPGHFEVRAVPIPVPTGHEVRVRIQGCGVCGSNLGPWEGKPWFKYPFPPGEPGHEGWGVVDAVGPEVSGVQPGDRVALLGYRSFAEFDLAPDSSVIPLPHALAELPFPGEPLGCAWNVFARSGIGQDQTVAIVGIGFLGALLTQLAASAGAKVIALSRRPFALDVAAKSGAAHIIQTTDQRQAIGQVKELTAGQGCDCVIEAVGQQNALDIATELTRERGRLVIAGYHQDGPRQVNMQLWNWRGLDVINAHERDPNVYVQGVRAAVGAILAGRLKPAPLITDQFRLDEIAQAFQCMEQRPDKFMKALVVV